MLDSKRRRRRTGGHRWLVRISGVILAATAALVTSLVPTSAGARPIAGDGDTIERRIQAVREAADTVQVQRGEQDASQVAQWRNWPNWPNWPNWGNYWNNWPNW